MIAVVGVVATRRLRRLDAAIERSRSTGCAAHFRAQGIANGRRLVNPLVQRLTGARVAPPGTRAIRRHGRCSLSGPTALRLRSMLSHQLIAATVGAGTIAMTGLAGRAAFGRRAGLMAALLVAGSSKRLALRTRSDCRAGWHCSASRSAYWLAYRFIARASLLLTIALGATVALLAVTRSEQIALVVFLLFPLVLTARGTAWRKRVWLARSHRHMRAPDRAVDCVQQLPVRTPSVPLDWARLSAPRETAMPPTAARCLATTTAVTSTTPACHRTCPRINRSRMSNSGATPSTT